MLKITLNSEFVQSTYVLIFVYAFLKTTNLNLFMNFVLHLYKVKQTKQTCRNITTPSPLTTLYICASAMPKAKKSQQKVSEQ